MFKALEHKFFREGNYFFPSYKQKFIEKNAFSLGILLT